MHESGGRGAGNDEAPLLRDEDRRTERLASRMLEHDVRILAAGQLTHLLAEPQPLLRILRVLVFPELVTLRSPVDDELRAHRPADVCLLFRGHDTHGDRAAVQRELSGVGAEAARRTPDEYDVALLHLCAVLRDELPVRR